jgi:hypothetical protein
VSCDKTLGSADLHPPAVDRRRRGTGSRLIAVVASIASVLVIAGCAVGQHAETSEEVPVVDGVAGNSGPIGIRNAGVNPPSNGLNLPAGGTATLQLVIVNQGRQDDQLTSVTVPSSVASGAVISISGPAAAPTDSGSASPSDSATPAASPPASDSGTPSAAITIPADSAVQVGYDQYGPSVTLTGLTKTLYPASNIEASFTFRSGRSIDAVLPVKLTSSAPPAASVNVSPSSAG